VMLYEALTGRRPFEGEPIQVLMRKQAHDAPAIEDEGIPADLVQLAMRLLSRVPGDRPDAQEIRQIASEATCSTATLGSLGPHDQIIGRADHIATMNDAIESFKRSHESMTVFVSGKSGDGKSTLAEHFLAPLRRNENYVVLSGRCYDRESMPFKALDSLIDALCDYLKSLPDADAALLLPDDIAFLAQLFPTLRRVSVVAKAASERPARMDESRYVSEHLNHYACCSVELPDVFMSSCSLTTCNGETPTAPGRCSKCCDRSILAPSFFWEVSEVMRSTIVASCRSGQS
jgi:serine/threonine protein kinase